MLPEFEKTAAASLHDPLEMRRSPRVATELPLHLFTTDFAGPLPARARDLSVGGVCIATPAPFAIKAVQRVVFPLAQGELCLEAQGRWQRDVQADDVILTGLQFIDPPSDATDRLWDMVFGGGKRLARFLYERVDLYEFGIEEGLGLAQVSRYRDIPAGRFVYRQDTRTAGEDSLFIVISGCIGLQVRVRAAREVETERLGPGELFGGMPLLADVDQPESACAVTDTRLLEVDREAFRYLRLAKPWLGYRVAQALLRVNAGRLRALLARLHREL